MSSTPHILILLVCLFATSCGTYKRSVDIESEKLTGVRTMFSNSGWTGADSLKNAINKAQKDCADEKKAYKYLSHTIENAATLNYNCI